MFVKYIFDIVYVCVCVYSFFYWRNRFKQNCNFRQINWYDYDTVQLRPHGRNKKRSKYALHNYFTSNTLHCVFLVYLNTSHLLFFSFTQENKTVTTVLWTITIIVYVEFSYQPIDSSRFKYKNLYKIKNYIQTIYILVLCYNCNNYK